MKKALLSVLILACTISLFHTYLNRNFPYTNDGENHLARFANYKIALKEGQIPPRFAPNLMNHYGYPVFNYNYPLANMLSVPFSLIKFNPETTYKLISITAFVFGMIGIYQLLHIQKKSLFTVVIGITLFAVQPYLANVVLFRGSIGELLAYCLLPWMLWSLHFLKVQNRFSLLTVGIWTAFFLSHNVTVLIAAPLVASYALLLAKDTKVKNYLTSVMLNFLLAVALSLWFWLPALLEANVTVVKEAGIANQFLAHLVTMNQLLFGSLQFGFSQPGPIDSLGFQIGVGSLFVILTALAILAKAIIYRHHTSSRFIYALVATLLVGMMQLDTAQLFWQLFPQLHIIQFPWRLSILLGTLIPLLWAESAGYYARSLKKVLILLCLLSIYFIAQLQPVDFFHRNQIDYDLFSQSTSTQNENRTKDFTYLEIGDWQPKPKILGDGTAIVTHWTGSDRKYSLSLQTPSKIIEPTMNFPGWETTITDSSGQRMSANYLYNNEMQGRLAFQLQPGEYIVQSRFTQRTPARIIGNTVTLTTFIALLGWQAWQQLIKKHDKSKTHSG